MSIVTNNVQNFSALNQLNPFISNHRGFIAGGVFKNILTGTPYRDVDVFFRNEDDYSEAVSIYIANECRPVYENDKARAFMKNDVRVELIKHAFGTPEDIISNFDFTITKFAYGYEDSTADIVVDLFEEPVSKVVIESNPFLIHHKDFFEHLSMKRLVVDDRLVLPVNTWERTYKYRDQGYQMCRDTKLAILQAIIERGPVEDNDLSQALYAGID